MYAWATYEGIWDDPAQQFNNKQEEREEDGDKDKRMGNRRR